MKKNRAGEGAVVCGEMEDICRSDNGLSPRRQKHTIRFSAAIIECATSFFVNSRR